MAEELNQMILVDKDEVEQRWDKVSKEIKDLKRIIILDKNELEQKLDKVSKDLEEFKRMVVLEKKVYKKMLLLDVEGFKQRILQVVNDRGLGEGEGSASEGPKVLQSLMPDNKAESFSELNDPSCSYYSISPPESIWKPYSPDPANVSQPRPYPSPYPSPSPNPDLRPRFASSPSCLSHHEHEPGSIPESKLRSQRFMEFSDARYDKSPDLTNSDHVHTSVSKNDLSGVSDIAPSVVSVSSFLGVIKIFNCSGLIIDWNSCNNEATILTSAKLFWRPKNSGFETHLIVRLGDGTLLLATEDYVDFYHSLVTLKVGSAKELKVVDLTAKQADIVDGMNVRALGRSFYTCSLIDSPRELHLEDPLFGCDDLLRSTCSASGICEGGPLISDAGFVVGMNFIGKCVCAHLLPTPIILNCLEMWRSYSTIVRPLPGISVVDVYPVPFEIWKRFHISPKHPYVAVKEVYKGSLADMNDVRSGDLVATCNGVLIKSAKQYYGLVSETSRAVTSCGDSGQQSLTVVINPCDGRNDSISIKADNVSVSDSRFHDCWPRVEDDGWSRLKLQLIMLKLKSDHELKQASS